VIRDSAGEQADRAVENITRLQLGPAEEAAAVQAMLDKGLTEDGAAQALGWPKARVTARVKLLELPEKARELVGAGVIPLSAVDQLRAIGTVSPQLLDVLVDYLDGDQDGHTWAASQLVSDPGYVLGNALRETDSKVFAAYLHQLPSRAVDELRLGKKATEQLAEAEKLHRQINQYAYGPPPIRFSEQDVDQARAAGVLIEIDHSTPIIVDRPLYRELAKGAIKRTVEELREQAERAKTERKQAASRRNGSQPEDPVEDARREHGRRVRELAEQAHGANLDLGWGTDEQPRDRRPGRHGSVAKFFVFGLLGSDYDGSPYTQSGDLVAELAARGIRLVIEEFRADVTKTLKDGSRGKLRIDYGDPKQPEKPIAWLWKFIDGAKTAGELYGRALVVIAAEQHASRLVVPSSQQFTRRSAGPRTRTTPPRRSRSSRVRTSRRRSSSSRRRSPRQAPSCTRLRSRLAPRAASGCRCSQGQHWPGALPLGCDGLVVRRSAAARERGQFATADLRLDRGLARSTRSSEVEPEAERPGYQRGRPAGLENALAFRSGTSAASSAAVSQGSKPSGPSRSASTARMSR
jgi:hypothetical protein